MYMRRGTRVTSGVCLGIAALGAPFVAFGWWDRPGTAGVIAGTILVAVPFLLGVPYLIFRCLPASGTAYQRDVLRDDLQLDPCGEWRSVQFVSACLPDTLAPGGSACFVLVAQNAHARRSEVRVRFRRGPLQPVHPSPPLAMEGGEVWCVAVPLRVAAAAGRGEIRLRYALEIRHPEGVGARTIRKDGLPTQATRRFMAEAVTIASGTPPAPAAAAGAWRLYGPGDAAPVLTAAQALLS